jgi:hypothetical protein
MASPNLSEIVTTTLRNRSGKLADNVTRNNALLNRLKEGGRTRPFGGGRTIVEEIMYANNGTYKRYSGYEALNITPSDVFTAAEFAIRQAAVAISISGLEMLQNRGKEAVIDLLRSRIDNAETTLTNGLSYDVYSDGTQSGQMNGLQSLISSTPTTGTVGGIDRATWTFWRNVKFGGVADGGGATSATNIQSYMNRVVVQIVRGADGPDLIVADNTYYRLYLESLQAIQRITSGGASKTGAGFSSLAYFGSGREIEVVLDGGFQGLTGDGNTFGASGAGAVGGAPSATMYFLNTKYLSYRPHRDRNCVPLDPERYSTNQDAMVKLIGWAGNMTISNSGLQAVLVA